MVGGWVARGRFPWRLVGVGALLCLPAPWVGLQLDDFPQRMIMLGKASADLPPLEVFSTLDGSPERSARFVEEGFLPWWTPAEARFRFLRPLAAASMWLDYQLWPASPWLMHVVSLGWYALLVLVAAVAYRRFLGAGWVAGLAALLFAVDDAHGTVVGWLANRNALLASTAALAALVTYDRARRDGSRWAAVLTPFLVLAALLSGEIGLGVVAYLGAYALFFEQGKFRARLAALLPSALAVLAWLAVYIAGGYGVSGSGFYLDPLSRPLAFLAALATRIPLLLFGQFSPVPVDAVAVVPPAQALGLTVLALAALVPGILLFAPLLRLDRRARFFAAGMIAAAVPVAATLPASRLLFLAGFGGMGLTAQLLAGFWDREEWLPASNVWRRFASVAVVLLILTHLVLAPLLLPLTTFSMRSYGDASIAAIGALPVEVVDPARDLILLNAPDSLTYTSYANAIRDAAGLPLAKRVLGLTGGPTALEVRRRAEKELEIFAADGLLNGPIGKLFRPLDQPFVQGEVRELSLFRVEVLTGGTATGPVRLLFTFRKPLEDPTLAFAAYEGTGFRPFTPPSVGETMTLPPARGRFER